MAKLPDFDVAGCDEASDCLSGICEWANETATIKRCAPVPCPPCQYYFEDGGFCDDLAVSVVETSECDGANHCQNGVCCTDGETCCAMDDDCGAYRCGGDTCLKDCPGDDDSRCNPDYHCYAGGTPDTCEPNANGGLCDDDGECDSGRCDGTCMAKLPDFDVAGCDEASDCQSGVCEWANETATIERCAPDPCPPCQYYFEDGGFCDDLTVIETSGCDGADHCQNGVCCADGETCCADNGDCGGYLCLSTTSTCTTTCASDGECPDGTCECSGVNCYPYRCAPTDCGECEYFNGSSCVAVGDYVETEQCYTSGSCYSCVGGACEECG